MQNDEFRIFSCPFNFLFTLETFQILHKTFWRAVKISAYSVDLYAWRLTFLPGDSRGSVNFLGTAPSTREKIRKEAGHKNFKDQLVDVREEEVNFQPRNHRQVYYYKVSERKFGPDPNIALHELAYMLPNFV
jgi:hypothetical protein